MADAWGKALPDLICNVEEWHDLAHQPIFGNMGLVAVGDMVGGEEEGKVLARLGDLMNKEGGTT